MWMFKGCGKVDNSQIFPSGKTVNNNITVLTIEIFVKISFADAQLHAGIHSGYVETQSVKS